MYNVGWPWAATRHTGEATRAIGASGLAIVGPQPRLVPEDEGRVGGQEGAKQTAGIEEAGEDASEVAEERGLWCNQLDEAELGPVSPTRGDAHEACNGGGGGGRLAVLQDNLEGKEDTGEADRTGQVGFAVAQQVEGVGQAHVEEVAGEAEEGNEAEHAFGPEARLQLAAFVDERDHVVVEVQVCRTKAGKGRL